MKIGIFNKKLWQNFSSVIAVICGIISFTVIFIDIPKEKKVISFLIFLVLIGIIFISMLISANKMSEKTLRINQTQFVIKFGDLFLESGLKTITFNEYFDTIVDEKLISSNTINGKFLNNIVPDILQIDSAIENDNECRKNIISIDYSRTDGKKMRYKLGTAIKFDEYVLVAFSKFNEHNQAYLTLADYLSCLANYWSEINRVYNGENVVLPLMGTGITRLMCGNSITCQKAMEIIIQTFEYSNLSFAHNCKITLVIHPSLKAYINLYDL